MPFFLQTALSH